jgi:hypothetical protein
MKCASRLGCILALVISSAQGHGDIDFAGHFKYRFTGVSNPANSVFNDATGERTANHSADVRLNLRWRNGGWNGRADYQLIGLKGDAFDIIRAVPQEKLFVASRAPTDKRRLFDLTDVITEGDNYAVVQRLDRLWLGHTGADTTVRFGRQAISWGNGLIYTPMDFFNPFDPAAVDKEYKPGDDMLYGQYALDRGDDIQGVMVFRRSLDTAKVETDKSTAALKYHGFEAVSEFDLLIAQHYGDTLAAAGGNRELGDSVWRGDAVVTRTDDNTVLQLVTSVTRSWTVNNKNVSGIVEYFYNGFGQSEGNYSPEALVMNPDLVRRIARGELFTLARQYIAASATVEITPLLVVTPAVFLNISDGSALLQTVLQHDLRQDIVLLGSLNIPVGPAGTEFGGIESGQPGQYLSSGLGIFFQLAAYF